MIAHVESARTGRQTENLSGTRGRGRGRETLVKCKFSAINSINPPHRSRLDNVVFAQSRCIAPMQRGGSADFARFSKPIKAGVFAKPFLVCRIVYISNHRCGAIVDFWRKNACETRTAANVWNLKLKKGIWRSNKILFRGIRDEREQNFRQLRLTIRSQSL